MKCISLCVMFFLLVTSSCKKDMDGMLEPHAAAPSPTPEPSGNATSAARPPNELNQIKGNWKLVMWGGGIAGAPPTPTSVIKKLKLKADMTCNTISAGIVSAGVYSLSTAPIPYPPGTKKLITFGSTTPPPPGTYYLGSFVYRYYVSHDTLTIVPNSGADTMYEVYVKE